MSKILNREPAVVVAALHAVLTVLVLFGFDLSTEQIVGVEVAATAILAFFVRSQVSPVE